MSILLTKKNLHTTDLYIKKLNEAGIFTVTDLIEHYPRTYENKSNVIRNFSYVNIKEKNTVLCEIETIMSERTKFSKSIIKAIIKDESWFLSEAVWFNQKYLLNKFHSWDKVILFWKPKYAYGKLSFLSPEIELSSSNNKEIKPIYPELNYISSDWFEKKIPEFKDNFIDFPNILPIDIIRKKKFHSKTENLYKIHFPKDENDFEEARRELAYEELYKMQYDWIMRKKALESKTTWSAPQILMKTELIKDILSKLPYTLTDNQKIVIFQIFKDMERNYAMKRLLQWDVWTGKTIVALVTAIHGILEKNIQVAFMVPTEILARQHFQDSQELLSTYGITSELLVGSISSKTKQEIKSRIKSGQINLIIGTHALIQDDVVFNKLGYVIIDEQHRFGVEQRKALEEYCSINAKKEWTFPHILNMTATPIPRTLALTIYWDQDVSIINEYPAGRKNIHTRVIEEEDRKQIYNFIEEEVKQWRQVYWISPLVEESDTLDIANATEMQTNLEYIFPDFNIWLLHGRMKPKEKDEVMEQFMANKIQILSSTSVVEVGVNNRNATIICIEATERFWLSQLHQFRWRVGRWEHQSYCYLFTTKLYKDERLRAMEKTNDGFELSEIDLELRWPWEVYGIRQSGIPDFKIANLKDFELISEIRDDIMESLK